MIAWLQSNWDWLSLTALSVAGLIAIWRDRAAENREIAEYLARCDLIRKGWER